MSGRPHKVWMTSLGLDELSKGSISEGEGATWLPWYSTSHELLFQDEFTFCGRLFKDELYLWSLTHQLPLSPCVVCPKNVFSFPLSLSLSLYIFIYYYLYIIYYYYYYYYYLYGLIKHISITAFCLSRHATWLILVSPVTLDIEPYCL